MSDKNGTFDYKTQHAVIAAENAELRAQVQGFMAAGKKIDGERMLFVQMLCASMVDLGETQRELTPEQFDEAFIRCGFRLGVAWEPLETGGRKAVLSIIPHSAKEQEAARKVTSEAKEAAEHPTDVNKQKGPRLLGPDGGELCPTNRQNQKSCACQNGRGIISNTWSARATGY